MFRQNEGIRCILLAKTLANTKMAGLKSGDFVTGPAARRLNSRLEGFSHPASRADLSGSEQPGSSRSAIGLSAIGLGQDGKCR
jgi:hypothetical protein